MLNNHNLDDIILAFAVKDKKHLMELINSINAKYLDSHTELFVAISDHFSDPKFKEIPTVEVLSEKLRASEIAGADKIIQNYNDVISLSSTINSAEFTWYLDKLRIRYNKKIQKECADKIISIAKQPMDEQERLDKANKVIKDATTNIDSIYRKQSYQEGAIDQSARDRFIKYEFVEKNPNAGKGVLTGYKEFDRITNGLHPGELMIIAGDTGTGKSVYMHNIGVNAYLGNNSATAPLGSIDNNSGKNVLYFSLEMPKETMERRLDSCMGDLFYNQIRDGQLSAEDKKKYFGVLKFQMNFNKKFYVVDMPQKVTTREIELKYMEILESSFVPDLVIIDYMGIMSPNNKIDGNDDWLSLGYVTGDLHEFARVYNVPVITGSQVNKAKDPSKPSYSTDRIARSSMAATNANVVIQIGKREDEYLRTDMPVFITKMRDGEQGSYTLNKNFAKMKITDMMDEGFSDGYDDDSI